MDLPNLRKSSWSSVACLPTYHETEFGGECAQHNEGLEPYQAVFSFQKMGEAISNAEWPDLYSIIHLSDIHYEKSCQRIDLIARLEEAANKGDERAFISNLRIVRWEGRPPSDFVRGISSAIKIGLPLAARHISTEGVKFYPNESEIQEYARLFAPARVLPTQEHSNSNQNANIAWLKAHGSEYRGKWVALKDGHLLGAEITLKELVQRIGDVTDVMLTPSY